MYEISDHPDAPSTDEVGNYVVEPVAPEEIRRNREEGLTLLEENLLEHDDLDVYVEMTQPQDRSMADIGTVLYRLVQIFGTPQLSEYQAGSDISWRTNETFKYLLRVRKIADTVAQSDDGEFADSQVDGEWLVTVFDHKVRLGIGLAAWSDDPDATIEVDPEEAVPLMMVVKNGVSDPIQCEYKNTWF